MQQTEKRNRDFLAAVEKLLSEGKKMSVGYAIRKANEEAQGGFYMCREYAYRTLRRRRRCSSGVELTGKVNVWRELERQLAERMQHNRGETEWEALDWVLTYGRMRGFNFNEEYARKLYNRCMKQKGRAGEKKKNN